MICTRNQTQQPMSPNFSTEEKFDLVELVSMYESFIENERRHEAWIYITKYFNSGQYCNNKGPRQIRSSEELQKEWEELKESARKYAAKQNEAKNKTEIIVPESVFKDDLLEKVKSVVGIAITEEEIAAKKIKDVVKEWICETNGGKSVSLHSFRPRSRHRPVKKRANIRKEKEEQLTHTTLERETLCKEIPHRLLQAMQIDEMKYIKTNLKSSFHIGIPFGASVAIGSIFFGWKGAALGAFVGALASYTRTGPMKSLNEIILDDLTPEQRIELDIKLENPIKPLDTDDIDYKIVDPYGTRSFVDTVVTFIEGLGYDIEKCGYIRTSRVIQPKFFSWN